MSTSQKYPTDLTDTPWHVVSALRPPPTWQRGGRRHRVSDQDGVLMGVQVTAADQGDREGLMAVLTAYWATGVKRLKKRWVDGGYRGEPLKAWVAGLKATHKIDLKVVQRPGKGFALWPRRWVVERTFAWVVNDRRHAKEYEVLTEHREALIQIALIHLVLKRLAPSI